MARQLALLERPRQMKRRIIMHYIDVAHDSYAARFRCHKCAHTTDWMTCAGVSEIKRGLPCPTCNKTPTK